MIIDAHAHLLPLASLFSHRSVLICAGGQHGNPYRAKITDAELEKSAAQNVAIMDSVQTDLQILSPRPFLMLNGKARWDDILSWVWDQNDTIARTVRLHPGRFRGVGALPQQAGRPVTSLYEEIKRLTEELGFIGVLLNPDPGEGSGETPPLGDPYWYPLYEKLCELDLPAHIHGGNCCNGRETYDDHFISEETLAVTSVYRAGVFERYPNLKLLISHAGGAIPFQVGRLKSHREMGRAAGNIAPDAPGFEHILRKFWFDTVLHHKKSLELLFEVVGVDRCCFGTERPGSGSGVDPETGRPFDDLKPIIESIESLNTENREAIFAGNARRLFSRIEV